MEPGCAALVSTGRCPRHAAAYERARLEAEPWRALYDDPRWRNVSFAVRRTAGWRCEFTVEGRRCNNDWPLSTHHKIKVSVLWKRAAGDYEEFVRIATDKDNLVCLCERHHHQADKPNPAPESVGRERRKVQARRRLHARSKTSRRPRDAS